jgi:hypothetical protein
MMMELRQLLGANFTIKAFYRPKMGHYEEIQKQFVPDNCM